MVVFGSASMAYSVYLTKHDPALLRRRNEAGISYEKEPAKKSFGNQGSSFLIKLFLLNSHYQKT